MVREERLSPLPVEQVEQRDGRPLLSQPKSAKRLSSASALSREIAMAFGGIEDGLHPQINQFHVDRNTTRKGSGTLSLRTTIDPSMFSESQKEHPETEGQRRRSVGGTREASHITEPKYIPAQLRPAGRGPLIDTIKVYRTIYPGERKTPRSARYETSRSSSKPRHPRPQHDSNSDDDSDTSIVDLYHKATGELARHQIAARRSVKPSHFPYTADTFEQLKSNGSHEHDDSDSDHDAWREDGNWALSPPPLPRPKANNSIRPERRPSRRSNDSNPNNRPDSRRGLSRQLTSHTFGGGEDHPPSPSSPTTPSRPLESSYSPKPSFMTIKQPDSSSSSSSKDVRSRFSKGTTTSGTSAVTFETLPSAPSARTSPSSSSNSLPPTLRSNFRSSSVLSKVLLKTRLSLSPGASEFAATPTTPTSRPTSTAPISPTFSDMPLLSPHQARQVHASLPPMNPPSRTRSSSSSSSGGLSLSSLAQKTKAITSAGFKTSEERRRAKLKSKIRVFGDGGTVLGQSEKGAEVIGIKKMPQPEMEQRRAGTLTTNYMSAPDSSSNSTELFGGATGTRAGGVVSRKELTDRTGPAMWTGGRFGARAWLGGVKGQQRGPQGLVKPFVVPTAVGGQMERGKSPARGHTRGIVQGQVQELGGSEASGLIPPPAPAPTRALPARPSHQQVVKSQENPATSHGNVRLGQVMAMPRSESLGGSGQKGGRKALMDARGNVVFNLAELDGVKPVL